MTGIMTIILCAQCQRTGRVQWGAKRPGTARFEIAALSAGFLFIEAASGAPRVECATCRTPVHGLGNLLGGYAPLQPPA